MNTISLVDCHFRMKAKQALSFRLKKLNRLLSFIDRSERQHIVRCALNDWTNGHTTYDQLSTWMTRAIVKDEKEVIWIQV